MKRGGFERYLELKGLGVVAFGWEREESRIPPRDLVM